MGCARNGVPALSEEQIALIWCPFPSSREAQEIAGQLLEKRLIACANITPQIISVFSWQGEIQSSEEVGVMMKTSKAKLAQAMEALEVLHPYDVPAISGWLADAAPEATRQWVAIATGEDETQ